MKIKYIYEPVDMAVDTAEGSLMLNHELANIQQITPETLTEIKEVHTKIASLKKKVNDGGCFNWVVRRIAVEIEELDTKLQKLWGFSDEPGLRNHTLKLKGCICTPSKSLISHRILSHKCPIHSTWDGILKPCPCCGSKAVYSPADPEIRQEGNVHCVECWLEVSEDEPGTAVEKWNSRV